MNECLVTRLKRVVDNDNLPKFGVYNIKVPNTSFINIAADLWSYTREATVIYAKALDGTYFITNDGTQDSERKSELDGMVPIVKVYVEGTLPGTIEWDMYRSNFIWGVMNIEQIWSVNAIFLSPIKYGSGELGQFVSYGSVDGISRRLPNLRVFQCSYNSKITGDISAFVPILSMTHIMLPTVNNVTGDIKTLAEGQVALGRQSGTLKIQSNAVLTQDGVLIGNNIWKTITFSSEAPNGYTITDGE